MLQDAIADGITLVLQAALKSGFEVDGTINENCTPLKKGRSVSRDGLWKGALGLVAGISIRFARWVQAPESINQSLQRYLFALHLLTLCLRNMLIQIPLQSPDQQILIFPQSLAPDPVPVGNSQCENPLIIAAARGHVEPMKLLLGGKANVEATDVR